MKQRVALTVGVALLLATGLGRTARAQQKEASVRKIEKHVVVRQGGGGYLGVVLEDLAGDARGAEVRSVEADSGAAKAGVEEGDVIVSFEGEVVRSVAQLSRLVRETPAGRSVSVEVVRDGVTKKLTATLGEGDRLMGLGGSLPGVREFRFTLPEAPATPALPNAPSSPTDRVLRFYSEDLPHVLPLMPRRLGIEFIEIGGQLATHFKLAEKSGVLVTSVDADTPAANAGFMAGDLILEFGGQKIRRGSELREAVAKAEAGKELVVKVQRDGSAVDLEVTLAKPALERIEREDVRL